MRVPAKVLNAVVFLGYRERLGDGSAVDTWGGTGLLVAIDDGDIIFPYVVTAHHVTVKMETNRQPIARVNDANGNGHFFPLLKPIRYRLSGEGCETRSWFRHPTDVGADVAVYPFSTGSIETWGESSLAYLPTSSFVVPSMVEGKEASIGIGDEIFVPGLVALVAGSEANSPLLRLGHIAMLPDRQIYSGEAYGWIDAYLTEVRSLGGLSGAPVFVRRTHRAPERRLLGSSDGGFIESHEPSSLVYSSEYSLLGLMHGHWNIPLEDVNSPEPRVGEGDTNLGLAVVVPAVKILETINHPLLIKSRLDFVAARSR
jgi:hypothetical protein